MEVIKVSNLSKSFEVKKRVGTKKVKSTIVAVDNISFTVNKGEIIGFIGPNGAGKSTTIKMLTGILFPTNGTAEVAGFNPWTNRTRMSYKIATMFGQKSSLLPHLPVIDSYKLLGAIYDIDSKTLKSRIEEIVSFFDIKELMDQKANSLSLGQRMICEVAAVTLHRPDVMFFDEPTIGLDIVVKKKVRDMILTLNKKYGTTIFITSHDISDIEKLCNRIVLINHGRVLVDSKLSDLQTSFLSKKKIVVTFDNTLKKENLKPLFEKIDAHYEIEKETITIEFDEKNISTGNMISKLITLGNTLDFKVSSDSLENLVYDIYTSKEE